MARCGRTVAAWGLGAALLGCAGNEVETPVVDDATSDDGALESTSAAATSETSTDAQRIPPEPEDGSSESSTTDASVDVALVAIAPGKVTDAERVDTLPIARTEADAKRRVVLQLDASELPTLQPGDRLLAAAEVQITTRCDAGQTAPGCDYDPQVAARLVIGDDVATIALSAVQRQTCTHAEHHCMFVFRPSQATLVVDGALDACIASADCRVSLEMWSWDEQARADELDHVLVGENEGDYLVNQVVGGDKARLMVVRERGELDDDIATTETTAADSLHVPTDASATLVYSHRLAADRLLAGEQFLVEAKFVTDVSSRARVSSLMFVTSDPAATEGAAAAMIEPAQIGEHNGINCTAGASPCTTRKVAVFRIGEDVDGPLFVNLVVKSAVPGGGSADVTVQRDAGWIRATRYAAALDESGPPPS